MTAIDFLQQFSDLKINKTNNIKSNYVNQSILPKGLYNFSIESAYYFEDSTIALLWITEDWDNNVSLLANEIERYYNYLAKIHNLESDINLEITIGTKDARESKYFDKLIISKSKNN